MQSYRDIFLQKSGKFHVAKKTPRQSGKPRNVFIIDDTEILYRQPPIPVILQLYETMLKPILCYGSEVWGFTGDQHLERVELHFLKQTLHLPA